jgi:hypothetical protein
MKGAGAKSAGGDIHSRTLGQGLLTHWVLIAFEQIIKYYKITEGTAKNRQGFRNMHVYTAADIKQIYKLTQKQIDDLDKSSVIKPSIRPAQGKGSHSLLISIKCVKHFIIEGRENVHAVKHAS